MSLASATALVPATSPTNSNGNFDPSFLNPPPSTQNLQSSPVQSSLSRPPPSSQPPSRPRVEVFAVYIHRRVVPTVVPCLRPVPPSSHPIDRAVGDDRTLPNKRAWLCTGQVACQRYPSGIATPPRRGDATAESERFLNLFRLPLTLLTSYDNSYGRLVRCDIPAPRSASSRL